MQTSPAETSGTRLDVTLTPERREALDRDLRRALLAEYESGAYYAAVLKAHNVDQPFAQLRAAEDRHAGAIRSLFTRYGLTPPEEPSAESIEVGRTLADSVALGVDQEQETVSLYEDLLSAEQPDDVRMVFERMREVSAERHLVALQRFQGTLTN